MADQAYKKGIVLAGGSGTRLYPVTHAVSKQLLPIYDKPMVYYPLSTLMLAGIRDILLVSTPEDIGGFERLLGNGNDLGISISYAVQPNPDGLPQAFVIGRDFIGSDNVALGLGDHSVYGQGFQRMLAEAASRTSGGTVFTYVVKNPQRYGVLELSDNGRPIALEEKPAEPRSNLAVTGLYFFDNRVLDIAAKLKPSSRGETEIVEVVRSYLDMNELYVQQLSRGFAWLDTGTHQSLLQASSFIETIEQRQGLKVACLEEAAYVMKFIDAQQLERLAAALNNEYGEYLHSLLDSPPAVIRPVD
ncbi:MAG: glucose-1-phosphate thymidylyltransferase RfbA [Planctomycetales bacterium]